MSDYRRGDVLKHRTRNRWLRVLDPLYGIDGSVYVRNTDAAGFEVDNKARWLSERHLARTYTLHFREADR